MTKRKEQQGQEEQDGSRAESETKCPICKKPVPADAKSFPFCTARCRQIDLGKWLQGDYVISRPIEQRDLDEE